MYKLIIIDDEPLVQIGMKSMIDYAALGIDLSGVASNGRNALELIIKSKPQIVITDIKMPVMDGLELIEYIKNNIPDPPLFIILTSYEEFDYARRAMQFNVVDYLVKMELSPQMLTDTLKKAIQILEKNVIAVSAVPETGEYTENVFINRFLNRLLNNVFTSEEEIHEMIAQFNLDFSGNKFVAAAAEIDSAVFERLTYEQSYNLYMCVLNMARETLSKYIKSYVVISRQTRVGIIFCFQEDQDIRAVCGEALTHVDKLCTKYFNIPLTFGVGRVVRSLMHISTSFSDSKRVLYHRTADNVILFCDEISDPTDDTPGFDMPGISQLAIQAIENYDAELFEDTIFSIRHSIEMAASLEIAIDIASCIVHLIIHNMENGELIVNSAFSDSPKSYQILYACSTKEEVLSCLKHLSDCVTEKISEQKNDPKNKIVMSAQNYINNHICEKLTLNEVSQAINISPNYLSSIFKKHCSCGFNDYVNIQKIKTAQRMFAEENLKIYQVSDMLGFDNSYYFSKVYKKITGHSPKEAMN